jgi:acetyltransferase-like isoleucine patch superfamily enzyme
MAGQKVGEDAIVGAHGVVTREVEAHDIVGGVPAKKIKSKHDIQKPEPATNS